MDWTQQVPQPGYPVRRATIKDVAALAGVSRSTASRALNGNGYVAPAVRENVQAAARELRYVVDVMARSLKQKNCRTIGVLVSDLRNPFYAEIAASIGDAARVAGYTMFLANAGRDPESELKAAERFVALRVSGVIATPISMDLSDDLALHGMPLLEVDRQFAPAACDGVVIDNRSGARALTQHLLDHGHRRIALLIDEMKWTTGQDRHAGYVDAMRDAEVPLETGLVVSSGWSVSNAREVAKRLLDGADPPTAAFAANNVLAEGVYRAVLELGLSIPDDLSLVSFDDAPWMSLVTPGITAVAQDAAALGRTAVENLVIRMEEPGGPAETVTVDTHVVERGSVRGLGPIKR